MQTIQSTTGIQSVKYASKLKSLRTLVQTSTFDRLLNECTVTVQKTGNIHTLAKPTTTQCGTTFELICALFLERKYPNCVIYHISELSEELQSTLNLGTKDIGIDLIMIHLDVVYPVQCKLRSLTWNPVLKRRCSVLLARELSTFFKACLSNPMLSTPIVCTSATECTAKNCINYTRIHFNEVFTTRVV
jgi:hypothetical protein